MAADMGYLVIAFFFGLSGGIVGRIKGSSFWIWFLISGLIPFFGLLAAVCYRYEDRELRRQCPACGRVVMLHDAVCTRCGTELEFPAVAIAPEAVAASRPLRVRAGYADSASSPGGELAPGGETSPR